MGTGTSTHICEKWEQWTGFAGLGGHILKYVHSIWEKIFFKFLSLILEEFDLL